MAIFAISLGLRSMELDAPSTPVYILVLSILAMPLLAVGNYLGAELVYRMGMRVNTGRLRETPLILKAVALAKRGIQNKGTGVGIPSPCPTWLGQAFLWTGKLAHCPYMFSITAAVRIRVTPRLNYWR